VIHLIAASRLPLISALTSRGRRSEEVRWWGATPHASAVKPGDFLVVDLLDGGPTIQPPVLLPMLSRCKAVLVTGQKAVAPEWLALVQRGCVSLVRCDREEPSKGMEQCIAVVEREARGLPGEGLAILVLKRAPSLGCVDTCVKAICEHPWDTRHPTQLGQLCGIGLTALKRRCHELGFRRVEHFIIAVRLIALQVVQEYGFSFAAARRLVGLLDSSNTLRQVKRAAAGSPMAFDRVASSCGPARSVPCVR